MAGTDRNRELITGGPAIILMEPQLGENIGMVARAMANFGLDELRLVAPRDEGVFYGAETVDGVRCAHPVQVYLDLLGQPERSKEAAEALRRDHLPWSGQ